MDVTELRNEFEALAGDHAPDLNMEFHATRSADLLMQIIVSAQALGAFAGLWNLIQVWLSRHSGHTVKVKYIAERGEEVEVEYTNLTRREAEEMIRARPPKVEGPVRVIVAES